MSIDPEAYGKLQAEALVSGLEQLKHQLIAENDQSLASQLVAGQAAVEAMKQLLGGLTEGLDGR